MAIAACLTSGEWCYASGGTADSVNTFGKFSQAIALSLDSDDHMFILDVGANTLVEMTRSAEVKFSVGGYGWTDGSFDRPHDVAISSGLDVYVADYGNHRIQRFDRNLNFVASLAGKSETGGRISFGYPVSVAVSRSGTLFISDKENNRIAVINLLQGPAWYFGGNDAREGKLSNPGRVRVTENDIVFVQDHDVIKEYDIFGNYMRTIGKDIFRHVRNFTVHDTLLFVLDSCSVYVVNALGQIQDSFDVPINGNKDAECTPVDLAIDHEKYVFLFDRYFVCIPIEAVRNGQRQ